MIQEKDFLYRVSVKNALVTAPGQQVRNPEILIDTEGGEFMCGNILDANSTNKLINQSVKEAVDNKLAESGYITKDLLEAETTRATEQENSLKTFIDVETSARTKGDEDLGSKIKAEQTRATGAESGLQAAIATKVDATALSNYVLTTALNQQVDTLNTAISAKQDAGSYIPYDQTITSRYKIDKDLMIDNSKGSAVLGTYCICAFSNSNTEIQINPDGITMREDNNVVRLARNGVTIPDGDYYHLLTSNGSTFNISEYTTQSDLNAQLSPKADRSDLLTLEKKITANTTALEQKQPKGDYVSYSSRDDYGYYFHEKFTSSEPFVVDDSYGNEVEYGINGITASGHPNCVPTTDGTFIQLSEFVDTATYDSKIAALEARITALEAKHTKATA